ncbi:hypothetical protein QEX66_gp01 [Arthrobacter phage Corgi]|uniref:Uncharacterized protein n=1 Tax=Arthrobacter phage Corgi TaxID=2419952 RepID=A0A3G2KEY9_9CAUD|nr:hypothetical protein QEX66_gp01 [Arthrobacter phage Corgi]AYN57549.1 hypothetical protein PBI_CORGI_1 [Arthrobacter phage Corgi]
MGAMVKVDRQLLPAMQREDEAARKFLAKMRPENALENRPEFLPASVLIPVTWTCQRDGVFRSRAPLSKLDEWLAQGWRIAD